MNIIESIRSDEVFKSLFEDPGTWDNWMVALKAIFGLPMDRTERRTYRKFTARTDRPSAQFSEAFLLVGRQGGKSFISALILVYLACFKKWDLGIGTGHIICIASDRQQAGVVLNYVKRILELPIFQGMVKTERAEEIELTNRLIISVFTCSYRALRGFRICAAVLDELAFYRVEGSNPAAEILTALRPSLGNVPGSLMLGISTPYRRSGPLYESHRDKFGKNDAECLVWKASTQDMNPSYSSDVIRRAVKSDPQAARSEYGAEFRDDLASFLPLEAVDAAIVPGRFELPLIQHMQYYAFLDPSGGRQDAMTLSIAHREESGRIIQDVLRVKKPPFDPSSLVKEYADTLRSYNVHAVESDRYGGEWVSSAFQQEGIFLQPAALSKSEIYLEALPLFMQGRVELLDHTGQSIELRQLERRAGRQRDSVDHPRGLHDDMSNACCGSLVMCGREDAVRLPDPSYGISEPIAETEEEKMAKEARAWLMGEPKKKPQDGVDMAEIEREMEEMEREIRQELANGKGK